MDIVGAAAAAGGEASDDSDTDEGGAQTAAVASPGMDCCYSRENNASMRSALCSFLSSCHSGSLEGIVCWVNIHSDGAAATRIDYASHVKYYKRGLLTVVRNNHVHIVDFLVTNVVSRCYLSECSLERAFLRACYSNYANVAGILINTARVNIDCTNKKGETGLMLACKYGCRDIIRLLLHRGADCNVQANQGYTTLHYAIHSIYCDYPIIIDLIVNGMANTNIINSRLETPLVLQIKLCMPDTPTAQALLNAMDKRYLDTLDDNGYNALQYACYYGDFDIALQLLHEGANPNCRARTGSTAQHLLVHKYYCTGMHDQEQQQQQQEPANADNSCNDSEMLEKMSHLFYVMMDKGGHLDLPNVHGHTAIDLLRGKHTVQPCIYCDRNRNLSARQAILRTITPPTLSCLSAAVCARCGGRECAEDRELVTAPARYLIQLHVQPQPANVPGDVMDS